MSRPRLFLSGVSEELRTARQAVAATVRTLGFDPVSQDDFPTGYGELRQWLREQIDSCEGLIQLVGHGYGAEPPEVDPDYGRASYTQLEFLYASAKGKKTWVIVIGEGCSRDKSIDQLDLPRDTAHSDPAGYQVERRKLQQDYLARLKRENHLRHTANNDTELQNIVLRLRDELGELRRQWEEWLEKDKDFKARITSQLKAAQLSGERKQRRLITAMPKVFICYRREDSAYPAHHIYDDLKNHYGADSVVFDVDTIPLGADFREYLNDQVSRCDVLLAVIGDKWAEMLKQRIEDADDFVRIEIQAALERKISVVPVLVGKASVPSAKNLPPEIERLAFKQAAEVRAGPDLQTHLDRLIRGLDRLFAEREAEEERKRKKIEEKRKAEEERKRKEEEVDAEQKAEDERKQKVAEEAKRRAEEAAKRKQAEQKAESAKRAEAERQAGEGKKRKAIPKIYKNTLGMEFVLIPAGSFTMGSNKGFDSEKPQHDVKISQSFYLQATEVTQGQWKKVMGDNPSEFKQCGDDCPVENASWEDAQRFIKKLNHLEKTKWVFAKLNHLEKTKGYRLPSEAEWEYACRAGTTSEFSFGDDTSKLGEYAWYSDNSSRTTQQVAGKKPNFWGLYDMHGNVLEWVEDDWHGSYDRAPADGRAWVDNPRGSDRVIRGGSWNDEARYCRSATRNDFWPGYRNSNVGFRLSRSVALGP